MARQLTYAQAINEGLRQCMEADPRVFVMGLGVPDPRGIFGTTLGLRERFGDTRVMDMPCSEDAMTGVAIGTALVGMRPVMTHQRMDFAVLAMEQLVNQAANWHYMYGGRMRVPLVVRMLVGRGWGQGPQHSQGLQSWFAHIPGLKVVMPATPRDAKGLLIAAVEDDNPVVCIEHRWLYNIFGDVPDGRYTVPLGSSRVARAGSDITLVGISYMTLEALRAADLLASDGIAAEVIDVRSLKPLDMGTIVSSVGRTGRLVVADAGWLTGGIAGEIVAGVAQAAWPSLRAAPRRVALPDCPTPTSPSLAEGYYPRAAEICATALAVLGCPKPPAGNSGPLDIPDPAFTGPF